MTKKKIIILTSLLTFIVAFIATMISVGVAYAASDAGNIAYLYNTNVLIPSISYAQNGNTITITDSDANNDLKVSKFDLIIVSDGVPFATLEASKTSIDGDNNYHLVYENLSVSTYGDMTISNGVNVSYVKAIIKEASYVEDEVTHTISYNNKYVSSSNDIKLLDFGTGYNPSRNKNDNLINLSNTIYALNDISIDEELEIKTPCSLDLLDYTLTLNDKFVISHNYGGNFYIRGNIVTTSNFSLIAPKANYVFYGSLVDDENASIIVNGDEYPTLLTDALDYIEAIIPSGIYDETINLYSHYMFYGVNYSYQYSLNEGSYVSLDNASLFSVLSRTSATKNISFKVTATKGTSSLERVISTKVYGSSNASFSEAIKDEIVNSAKGNVSYIDVLSLLKDRGSYFSDGTIKISLNPDGYLDAHFDVNGVCDEELNEVTISKSGSTYSLSETTLTSLSIHKGLVSLNTLTTFEVDVSDNISSGNISFVSSSKEEIERYFKMHTSSVYTENIYSIYSIRNNGIYLGENQISDNDLGISSFSFSVINDGLSYPLTDYFTINKDSQTSTYNETLTFRLDAPELVSPYLVCTITLEDESSFTYQVQMAKVSEGQAGEETTFKSSNPFDDVFSQTDTNWLVGTTFDFNKMTNYPTSYYANISVISIDGTTYDGSAISRSEEENGTSYTYDISKVVSINGDSSDTKTLDGKAVYRTIDIDIDVNYVPARDVKFIVKCIAYDDTEVSVEQDYIITIPGILKCEGDTYANDSKTPYIFKDATFYSMCVSLFDEIDNNLVDPLINNYKPTEESADHYYILSQACSYQGTLDFTSLTGFDSVSGLDITGLENLSRISSINLSSYPLSDISSLQYATKVDLSELILSSCSLTDAKLYLDENSSSYLYNLNLSTLDLSNNDITRTNELVYRSVTKLNLSNQTNLSSIDGLKELNYLQEIDLSNNKIYRFLPLRNMNSLKYVYIYGNVPNKLESFYGSQGMINLPVYTWMIKTNSSVKIFAYEEVNASKTNYLVFSDTSGINNIQLNVVDACTSLNAFAVESEIYNVTDLNFTLPSYGTTHEAYRRVGRPTSAGITEDNVTSYYYFDGSNYVQGTVATFSEDIVYYSLVSQTDEYTINFFTTSGNMYSQCEYLIDSTFEEVNTVNVSSGYVSVSYFLAYFDAENNLLAVREFVCNLYCSF